MKLNDNLELLIDICSTMQAQGLVASKAEFSTRVLGKSPSYLSSMAARNRRVDDSTISELKRKVEEWILQADAAEGCCPADLLSVYIMIAIFEHSRTAESSTVGVRKKSLYRWWGAMKVRLGLSPSGR